VSDLVKISSSVYSLQDKNVIFKSIFWINVFRRQHNNSGKALSGLLLQLYESALVGFAVDEDGVYRLLNRLPRVGIDLDVDYRLALRTLIVEWLRQFSDACHFFLYIAEAFFKTSFNISEGLSFLTFLTRAIHDDSVFIGMFIL
jgi:hypothetical protein